jgi:amino acid transporter
MDTVGDARRSTPEPSLVRTETLTPAKGLRAEALGPVSSVVIGVGSTAPAYSLAASLGLVTASVGWQAPAVLWLAFLPMFCVAAAYASMNRKAPDCGTTFAWVSQAMGAHAGWMAGWAVVIANLLVMSSLAHVAGGYTLQLLLGTNAPTHGPAVFAVGLLWIAGMTWLCIRGIEATAKTQVALLAGELAVLTALAVVGLAGGHASGTAVFEWRWLNPAAAPSAAALARGFLVAVFLFWGWDTAVSVNEETRNARHTPGRAALLSTLVLLATYLLSAVGALAWRGPGFLSAHSDDVLMALGRDALGAPWDRLVALAVLASAAACTQTTILPSARTSLSMATARAVPRFLGRIHSRFQTPHVATALFGIAAGLWHLLLGLVGADPLSDGVPALGLVISAYLGLSSLACPLLYGRELTRDLRTFAMAGLLPVIGGATFVWVLFRSAVDLAESDPRRMLGVSTSLLLTGFLVLVGAIIMAIRRCMSPGYFRRAKER